MVFEGDRFGYPIRELLEILSLEQSVGIVWIPVHRELAISHSGSDSSWGNSHDLNRFCNFHRFIQFGHDSPSNRSGIDMGLEFSKLYGTMTAMQMAQNHGMWTFIVRFQRLVGKSGVRHLTSIVLARDTFGHLLAFFEK